jgi:F-type H+/Na+-transporting ATPase subunit alpha
MPRSPASLDQWLHQAAEKVKAIDLVPAFEQVGRVETGSDGIVLVSGLPDALDELLRFDRGQAGFALTLDRDTLGCVLLDDPRGIEAGDRVFRTGEVIRVPVGPSLLGRIVDPLGRPLDGAKPIATELFEPIERRAPSIIERDFVDEPVQTGVLVIDAMFALGRGQRELIIGDRAIGKTALAVDTVINQKTSDIVCVYVAVGQKSSTVARIINAIETYGAPERCISW